ncbi:MAG: FAD-dependent oxidoreductase, partial [Planctomycetaceae bacterium]
MKKRVVIVGGGVAGLAAAEALSARKHPVVVLEARPRLGGRASSFEDKTTGVQIDNCQHVSLGCCTNFRHFCDRAGLSSAFRTEPELTFIAADGRASRFRAGRLPAPLHLAPAFGRLRFLSLRDKFAIAHGLSSLAKADARSLDEEPFDSWLARHRQTEETVNRFWHVVIVSALSESLERVSTAQARKVFVDSFLANRHGWSMQVPTVPLDELYGTRLIAHLERQKAVVRTGAGVRRLIANEGRIVAVELRTGERVAGDEFILAVPHHLVRSLLPESAAARPELDDLD